MSTVIRNGFRIATTDATILSDIVRSFSSGLAAERLREHARLVAERTCSLIDRSIVFGREWPSNALSTVFGQIDDEGRISDAQGLRRPAEDFGMSISLIPDARTGSTYGIVHCDRPRWTAMWMRQAAIDDFHWYDNTDRPGSVSAQEWRLRAKTWKRIMPSFVPAEHGFSARISETRVHFPRRDIMRFQPSLDRRRRDAACEILISKAVEEAGGTSSPDCMAAIIRESSRLRSAEGAADVAIAMRSIRIPARITDAIARSPSRPDDSDLRPA